MNDKKIIIILAVVFLIAALAVFGAVNKSKPVKNKVNKNQPQVERRSPEELQALSQTAPYVSKGYENMSKKDFQGAVQQCSKAIEIYPKDVRAYRCVAYAKMHLNDYSGAIQTIEQAQKANPEDKSIEAYKRMLEKRRGK